MFGELIRKLRGLPPTVVVAPRPHVIKPVPAHVVQAPPRFAWDEKRWRRHDKDGTVQLTGHYEVLDQRTGQRRQFNGLLSQNGADIVTFIKNPPREVRMHRHGACLQLTEAPWFILHWKRRPRTLDDALLYVERMLDESFNGYRS